MNHRWKCTVLCLLLALLPLGGHAQEEDSARQAFLSAFDAAQGEAVVFLEGDYLRGGDLLGKSDGTHVIIDGQGHSIQGMILCEGTYTFRNCTLLPIPVDDSRPHEYPFPGLRVDYIAGPVHITLEDSVTLRTGPESGSVPVEIYFAADDRKHPPTPMQVFLHSDARAEGDGIAVAYRKIDAGEAELHLSGDSAFPYAFCWSNEGAFHYEGLPAPEGGLPFLHLLEGVDALAQPERIVIPDLAPLQLKDEGPPPADPMDYHTQKYLLPFTLHKR